MIRRHFLKYAVLAGLGLMAMTAFHLSYVRKAFYRIQSLFAPGPEAKPEGERAETALPPEGPMISVETALNSRCTSDGDNNPMNFHWGMFDFEKKLSPSQIERIIQYSVTPRFTSSTVQIRKEANLLTFVVDNRASGLMREWVMIESGMQQQAVGLVCSALGVGHVFANLGRDGTPVSEAELGTVKIKVDPMKPGYGDSCWTSAPPEGSAEGRNVLPAPVRKGAMTLLHALRELKTEEAGGGRATLAHLGQLLWAARGRTPHYYKSSPWGMTIPTWGGEQSISNVSVIFNNALSTYINWRGGTWDHALDTPRGVSQDAMKTLLRGFDPFDGFVLLGRNETSGRALWEIGYQLLNIMLQAKSLGLKCRAVLLDDRQRNIFVHAGIKDPIALLSILMEPVHFP